MAICHKCGALKLTEQPCARCGSRGNENEAAQGGSPNQAELARAAEAPIGMPEGVPMLAGDRPLGFDSADEIEPAFNMRDWIRDAVQAKGAKMVGGGVGFGQADIDIDLEGHRYNISIRALKRS